MSPTPRQKYVLQYFLKCLFDGKTFFFKYNITFKQFLFEKYFILFLFSIFSKFLLPFNKHNIIF